jgi:hypothetical protein
LVPQITGGFEAPGLDTEKVSVRHCEATEAAAPPPMTVPPVMRTSEVDLVEGPVTTNVFRSRRI